MSKVIVVDRIEERLTLARANGADQVLDNSQTPLAEQLDGLRPTLIIDAAYHPSILPEVMALASIRAPCAQSLLPLWRRLTTTIGPSAHRQRAAMAAASSRQRSVHLVATGHCAIRRVLGWLVSLLVQGSDKKVWRLPPPPP